MTNKFQTQIFYLAKASVTTKRTHNTAHPRQTRTQNQTTINTSPKPTTQQTTKRSERGMYRYIHSCFQNMNPSFQRDGFLFNFKLFDSRSRLPALPVCVFTCICVCVCVCLLCRLGRAGRMPASPRGRPKQGFKGRGGQPRPDQLQHWAGVARPVAGRRQHG